MLESVELDIEHIKKMLPHRYPMLMVDRLVGVVANKKAVGIKSVTINEPFFQGHFPTKAVMPGVLIIEAMGQTAAALVVYTLGINMEVDPKVIYFMSVEGAKFRKPVRPGDMLYIEVTKDKQRGNVWKFTGKAKVDGALVAEATYTAMIVDV